MKIGFLGAGNMARAMAVGLLRSKACAPSDLACIGGGGPSAARLAVETGIALAATRRELFRFADVIILSFKPQHLETISPDEAADADDKLVVSILAGRALADLRVAFPAARNLARVMPNTPSRIGRGVSTFCFHSEPSADDRASLEAILRSLGSAYEIEERQLHISTVINGCGPAFYFRLIQLIGDAAESRGLDRELAMKLACETGLGSLELLRTSGQDPASLIREVVSPNGVTHALLTRLDALGLPGLLDAATQAAVDRSVELSEPKRASK